MMRGALVLLCAMMSLFQATAEVTQLTSEEFYNMTQEGAFDAIVDVRTQGEWDAGHIEGAFLVESLASYDPMDANATGTPEALAGCEFCRIGVYCSSGRRAGQAITILENNGFKTLYNGLGVQNWLQAGYTLVNSPSVQPPCTTDDAVSAQCKTDFDASQPTSAGSSLRASRALLSVGSGILLIICTSVAFAY